MRPARLSEELRFSHEPVLRRRRGIALLTLLSMGGMAAVSLFQLGILRDLPDVRGDIFDAESVDAAPEAYGRLSMPDGVIGLGSYAVTLALAAADGERRVARRPWLPILLGAKTALDAVEAVRLTVAQWRDHRAFSLYGLLATGATLTALPLAIPEAWEGLKRLTHPGQRNVLLRSRDFDFNLPLAESVGSHQGM